MSNKIVDDDVFVIIENGGYNFMMIDNAAQKKITD